MYCWKNCHLKLLGKTWISPTVEMWMACITHWDRNQQKENHLKWLVHFEPNAHTLHCCQENQDENLTIIVKVNIPIEKWDDWGIFLCISLREKSDQRQELQIIDKVLFFHEAKVSLLATRCKKMVQGYCNWAHKKCSWLLQWRRLFYKPES